MRGERQKVLATKKNLCALCTLKQLVHSSLKQQSAVGAFPIDAAIFKSDGIHQVGRALKVRLHRRGKLVLRQLLSFRITIQTSGAGFSVSCLESISRIAISGRKGFGQFFYL
jgi:hypothetical protein